MIEILSAVSDIATGLADAVGSVGFSLYYPVDFPKNETPVVTENDRKYVMFDGNGGSLKIEYTNKTVALLFSENTSEQSTSADYSRLTLSLLDPDEANEKDIRYIISDFSETIESKFANGKKPKTTDKKLPVSVSRTAVKNGAYYDAASFGNRFVGVYPELREAYKQNINQYGEFLPEDFFKRYGTPAVMQTIKENNPQKMKKLFNLLNDIYENGINDVQSLIVVSILGNMYDDETLLANCTDYMNGDLCVNVIRVNKYLGKSGSKGMRMRLENPPRYKVKKANKQNIFSNLLGGGQPQQ